MPDAFIALQRLVDNTRFAALHRAGVEDVQRLRPSVCQVSRTKFVTAGTVRSDDFIIIAKTLAVLPDIAILCIPSIPVIIDFQAVYQTQVPVGLSRHKHLKMPTEWRYTTRHVAEAGRIASSRTFAP